MFEIQNFNSIHFFYWFSDIQFLLDSFIYFFTHLFYFKDIFTLVFEIVILIFLLNFASQKGAERILDLTGKIIGIGAGSTVIYKGWFDNNENGSSGSSSSNNSYNRNEGNEKKAEEDKEKQKEEDNKNESNNNNNNKNNNEKTK